jgi:hypothetical protein
MSTATSWRARLYRFLFHYLDLYESRLEAFVVPLELALIGFGLWFAVRRFYGLAEGKGEMAIESVEMVVFLLLLGLLLSRYAVRVRGSRLGYAYERIVQRLTASHEEAAFRNFRDDILSVPLGGAPGRLAVKQHAAETWRDRAHSYAGMIAGQTARLLSVRSWLYLDNRWQERERDALSEWFTEFPSGLWIVPEDDAVSSQDHPAKGGYYCSIIVPMTRASWRSIRTGQRAADLAELDREVLRRVATGLPSGAAAKESIRIDFLAYVHIHVPKLNTRSVRDEMRLLASSIQHLAFLLYAVYGANDEATSRWTFSVLCESSNRHMNSILHRLGFVQLRRHADGSETQRREARSYAGFSLFELRVEGGIGADAKAKDFVGILWSVVSLHAQHAAANAASKHATERSGRSPRDRSETELVSTDAVRAKGVSAATIDTDPGWHGEDG